LAGVMVATLAISRPGEANAAFFAAEILALNDAALYERLAAWRTATAQEVLESKLPE
jgi:5-(carboxyamino)imidazole ribonucleotide mutase